MFFVKFKNILITTLPTCWVTDLRAYWHWFFGDPELRLLRFLNDPTKCSIDVGANVGIYTFFLKKYSSICHAIEPNPNLVKTLRQCFSSGVSVFEGALSDQNGSSILSIPVIEGKETHGLASIEDSNPITEVYQVNTTTVVCRKLDDMDIVGTVGFIKIDVEGHELSALKGGIAVLERDRPNIMVEAEERHIPGAVKNLVDFLTYRNYKGFFLLDGYLHPVENFDLEKHQNLNHASTKGEKTGKLYVNIFIFIRDETVLKQLKHLMVR
jgi:FkbM family methyltransferase